MKPWGARPFEIRNLFNPAFCGIVIIRALQSFEVEDEGGMPFSLSPLILPLCLHKQSREIITRNPKSYLLRTIQMHPEVLVRFPERTRSLTPYTFEALGVCMQHQAITVSSNGRLQTVTRSVRKRIDGTSESIECQQAARIIGRHFARINDRATIYTSLGIRP
jgi:Family of unknown function (DUF6521)